MPALVSEPEAEAPVPDLLGSILTGQSLLMMSGSDVVINRDGSLTAKKAVPLLQGRSGAEEALEDNARSRTPLLGTLVTSSDTDPANSKAAISKTCASSPLSPSITKQAVNLPCAAFGRAPIRFEYSMTPRSVQTQNLTHLNRYGTKLGDSSKFNGGCKLSVTSAPSKLYNNSGSISKTVHVKQPLKSSPKRLDIAELPRIPKIKKEANSECLELQSASDQNNNIPSSCIMQLTGKGNTNQQIKSSKMESSKPNAKQQPACTTGGSSSAKVVHGSSSLPPARGQVGSSSFESFKINIPGNTGHSNRLSNPGFCNTFRPVDNKVQLKEYPSPLFSLKKTKPVKSEIYDPFDPTGSDSSSTHSSPERLPLTNITRTISITSPKVQTFQTMRCITPYPLENIFGPGDELLDVPPGNTESHVMTKERFVEQISDAEQEKVGEDFSGIPCTSSATMQVTDAVYLSDDDKDSPRIVFEGDQDTAKMKKELTSSLIEKEQQNILENKQTRKRSFSRSPSNSSSQSQREVKIKKTDIKEYKHFRSRSRSRTHSRDRSSRSTSSSVDNKYSRNSGIKKKTCQSSSDCSNSHEQSKKKKVKSKTKDRKTKFWPKERKRSTSQSGSPGNSSFGLYGNRKKKKHSASRVREQECSRSNSVERTKKKKHRREKSYDRYEKERTSRSRDRKRSRSREKHKRRSRSPLVLKSYESKGSKSKEKVPQSQPGSKERKYKPKEMSPFPVQDNEHRSSDDHLGNSMKSSLSWVQVLGNTVEETMNIHHDLTLGQEISPKDNVIKVAFEEPARVEDTKLVNETIPSQPDCTDFEALPDNIDSSIEDELSMDYDSSEYGNQSSERPEEIEIKQEDSDVCPFLTDTPLEKEEILQSCDEANLTLSESKTPVLSKDGDPGLVEMTADVIKSELEAGVQSPVLKSKALVKRVTWNLQEEESDTVTLDKTTRVPFCKQQRTKEGVWKAEDLTQTLNQVYNQTLPLSAPLPSVLPPYVPVSQPTVQFIMQGSLPLLTCVAGQELIPEPDNLTTASEPDIQAASTGDTEENVKASKSPVDKTKNEEYMKKLHMQERAVEEVKLAIKPFYQKREITKEEYKDILRKAVQKICHSKSGEINPVKVANLVKAYVEKYKHIRKHKKSDAEEEACDSKKK